jgi:hypothetical protein
VECGSIHGRSAAIVGWARAGETDSTLAHSGGSVNTRKRQSDMSV